MASTTLKVYTDGSVKDPEGSRWGGCAFVFPYGDEYIGRAHAMGKNVAPWEAEMQAILHALRCVRELREENAGAIRNVQLFCDCQAVIDMVYAYTIKAPTRFVMGQDVLFNLRLLEYEGCNWELLRVQGHDGVPGNEFADHMAKRASAAARRHGEETCSWVGVRSRPLPAT